MSTFTKAAPLTDVVNAFDRASDLADDISSELAIARYDLDKEYERVLEHQTAGDALARAVRDFLSGFGQLHHVEDALRGWEEIE